jgi:hypothetical protein
MARTQKARLDGHYFWYQVGDQNVCCDVDGLFPNFTEMSEAAKSCIFFSLKTASRNCTAGVLESDLGAAIQNVKERLVDWTNGIWKSARQGGVSAEPRQSVLARAIALATGKSLAEAAEMVSAAVAEAIEEAGLDEEDSGYPAAARKIAASVRKELRTMVAKSYATIQLQDKQAALESGLQDTMPAA